MHVSGLFVYPLKGAAPIRLERAILDEFGIRHDRRWMVVDPDGRFITAREHPRLLQLGTSLDDDTPALHSDRAGDLRLDGEQAQRDGAARVRIWLDTVPAVDEGDAAAAFITRHLGFTARLVFMPGGTVRQVDRTYAAEGDRVSFADGFPLLLIGQSSLDELNSRLTEPVPMQRFRPNIVVAGAAANEEDTWRRIRLGNVACDVVKPCARCVVTTIDPATAIAAKEPLRTLAGYRQLDGKVWFGQNLIHRATLPLELGEPVDVLERGLARPPIGS